MEWKIKLEASTGRGEVNSYEIEILDRDPANLALPRMSIMPAWPRVTKLRNGHICLGVKALDWQVILEVTLLCRVDDSLLPWRLSKAATL